MYTIKEIPSLVHILGIFRPIWQPNVHVHVYYNNIQSYTYIHVLVGNTHCKSIIVGFSFQFPDEILVRFFDHNSIVYVRIYMYVHVYLTVIP